MNRDLDIMQMIDTIYKLKATLRVLVKDSPRMVMKIKKNYFKAVTVETSDSTDREKENTFAEFLDRDDKFNLTKKVQHRALKRKSFELLK